MDHRVRRAAEIEGVSVSEFLRRAALDRSERTLSAGAEDGLPTCWAQSAAGATRPARTGIAFTEALVEKRRARR